MIKLTKANLKKIEDIFTAQGYVVRYEKGNFNSGYCLVEDRKIVVVNKFFDTEGRANTLLDILSKIEVKKELLDDKQASFYKKLYQ